MQLRRKELYTYSLLWGVLSFAGGIAVTLSVLPDEFKIDGIPEWKMATWIWVNAHGIPIAEKAISGSPLDFGNVELIQPSPELHLLRVIPIFLATISGLLVVNSMRGFRNDSELIEYNIYAAGGYIIGGLGAIVLTEARPGIVTILILIAVLGAAVYIGSAIANSLPVPLFAVTSISGLVGIGLLVLLGAGAVLTVAVPLGKYAIAGALLATVSLWIGNNVDI